MELGWTTELGEAFVADQAGVLDATQRLRQQAIDVGNLQSSEQMKVETVPVRPTPSPIVEERTRVLVPPVIEKRTTTETIETDD